VGVYACVGVSVYRCMGVWECGCLGVGVWVYACMVQILTGDGMGYSTHTHGDR